MIINVIHICGIMGDKAEDHPPVGAHCYRPEAFQISLERMQPEPGQVHILHCSGGIEPHENIPQFLRVFRDHAARVVIVVQTP